MTLAGEVVTAAPAGEDCRLCIGLRILARGESDVRSDPLEEDEEDEEESDEEQSELPDKGAVAEVGTDDGIDEAMLMEVGIEAIEVRAEAPSKLAAVRGLL